MQEFKVSDRVKTLDGYTGSVIRVRDDISKNCYEVRLKGGDVVMPGRHLELFDWLVKGSK